MSEEERELQRHHDHIVNEILLNWCPRPDCRQPFDEFSGCLALTCFRCNAAFCALCFKDCGNNAHAHVREVGLTNVSLHSLAKCYTV